MISLYEIIIIWFWFQITKSSNNALLHDYTKWKQRLGIPDKWDWWFNPNVSHQNKYKSWLWKLLTPFSDFWHTNWTVFQIGWTVIMVINFGWYGLFTAIAGVFIIFNGLYNFLRFKPFVKL